LVGTKEKRALRTAHPDSSSPLAPRPTMLAAGLPPAFPPGARPYNRTPLETRAPPAGLPSSRALLPPASHLDASPRHRLSSSTRAGRRPGSRRPQDLVMPSSPPRRSLGGAALVAGHVLPSTSSIPPGRRRGRARRQPGKQHSPAEGRGIDSAMSIMTCVGSRARCGGLGQGRSAQSSLWRSGNGHGTLMGVWEEKEDNEK
jgi:hypothetical protein